MGNLNQKQKKIISIILLIIAILTYYYFYTKNNTEEINNKDLEISNNQTQETKEEKIVVHITGAVNKEGIIELEENARLADAIEKAGGAKENADIKNINLATILEDGMKVHIPTVEETKANNQNENNSENSIETQEDTQTKIITSNTKTQGKININTATEEELDTLPGIGPSTANKIIDYRKENGKFKSVEEIKEVSGIGDAKYEKIKKLITI